MRRSINLALSTRGKEALKNVGLLEKALELVTPMYGRAIHTKRSHDVHPDKFQPYDEIDPSNFHHGSAFGINRSDDLLFIAITVFDTRTTSQKQALYQCLVERL